MKASVVVRITIAASPAEVFKYLANLQYHYLWNPQTESFSSLKPLKLGTRYTTVNLLFGMKVKARNVVTKFVQDSELEVEDNTGIIQYRANFRLSPVSNGTNVRCTTMVSSEHDGFAFAKPVLKLLARRELQTDLSALKIAVEERF